MNTLHSQMCADMVLRGMSPRTPQHYRGAAKRCRSDQTTQMSFSSRWAGRPDVLAAKSSASRHLAAGELEELSQGSPGC